MQQVLGADKVDIEIVAYGPGIGMPKADSVASARVQEATQAGIRVIACEATMKIQKLGRQDMNTAVGYVPAGVIELSAYPCGLTTGPTTPSRLETNALRYSET